MTVYTCKTCRYGTYLFNVMREHQWVTHGITNEQQAKNPHFYYDISPDPETETNTPRQVTCKQCLCMVWDRMAENNVACSTVDCSYYLTKDRTMAIKDTLNERGKTHGDFQTNALLSQKLKDVMRESESWDNVDTIYRESLDMICLKISRILSGHANFKDHWVDIAGYAQLVADRC